MKKNFAFGKLNMVFLFDSIFAIHLSFRIRFSKRFLEIF